jgi:hypothetical protein
MVASKTSDFAERFAKDNSEVVEFPIDILQRFIDKVVLSKDFDDKATVKELCDDLLDKYRDAWGYTLVQLKNIVSVAAVSIEQAGGLGRNYAAITELMETNSIQPELAIRRVFLVLDKCKRPTPQLAELPVLLSVSKEKKVNHYRTIFKSVWTELLRVSSPLDRSMIIKMLRVIPDSVLPHVNSAEIFASFFSNCFSNRDDDEIALLAVSGLFTLISRHNLGEPVDLYSRLYQLITPESMSASSLRRHRVFSLVVKALRSPLMPSHYAPVFAKRLLRCAVLTSHPEAVLWLTVAAFNLVQSHQTTCRPLIHREDSTLTLSVGDAFDPDCRDIDKMANVVPSASCAWEIELLMVHSDPSIVRIAQMFKTNFYSRKAKRIATDDYLLITEEQLYNREKKYGSHSKKSKNAGEAELDKLVSDEGKQRGTGSLLVFAGPADPEWEENQKQIDELFFTLVENQ